MNTISKTMLAAGLLTSSSLSISAQRNIVIPPGTPIHVANIAKVKNNGKILSKKGIKSILYSDLTGMWVTKDTTFISLKEDVLKRIDKDKENYVSESKKKKTK